MMKRILLSLIVVLTTACAANAYQVISSKELGQNDAKNQNVVVKCTTDTGRVSNQDYVYLRQEAAGSDH